MNRGKKALYNSLASALSQIVSMVCGFILPRLILSAFGSSYNGIASSVAQFLSVVALLRAGIGGATRAALYKSLAANDQKKTNAIIRATEIFMRKVALIFIGFVLLFSVVYPYFVKEEFEWLFVSTLVLIISLSTFVQYFFGITYQILLQADQRQYVSSFLEIVTIILNTAISAVLIKCGVGIHGVKLGSAVAFSISPVVLNIIAKKQYHIERKVEPDFSSISQRWDAFSHQLAAFIHNNTDIVLLTIFTNTKEISVYTVYYLVANGLKRVMNTMMVGVESAFGSIIANNEKDVLKRDVVHYETLLHIVSSALFGAAIVLVTPFVQVYTRGINDVEYTRVLFGYLVIIGEMLFILRSPYEALVNASGYFKQTKKYAYAEAGINLFISTLMVHKFGLVGVVIGTVAAISFRNIAYAMYASKAIIYRSPMIFIKRFAVTGATVALIFFSCKLLPKYSMTSYIHWAYFAVETAAIAVLFTVLLNLLFFKDDTLGLFGKVSRILKKKR